MANIIDATAAINIGIIAQGFADLLTLTASPNPPPSPGATITVSPTIRNTGATDTLWMRKYVNGVETGSAWSASVNAGSLVLPLWTFVLSGTTALVRVDATSIKTRAHFRRGVAHCYNNGK